MKPRDLSDLRACGGNADPLRPARIPVSHDYYSPQPTRIPRLAIALTGDRGGSFDRVARLVGALTGLPLADLRELVEHDYGGPIQRLREELGEVGSRDQARAVLDRALAAEPHGILVIEAAFLSDVAVVEMLRKRSVLVHLRDESAASDARRDCEHDTLSLRRRQSVDLAFDTAVLRFELGEAPHQVARAVISELGLDDAGLD